MSLFPLQMPFYPQQSPGVGWPFFDPRYVSPCPVPTVLLLLTLLSLCRPLSIPTDIHPHPIIQVTTVTATPPTHYLIRYPTGSQGGGRNYSVGSADRGGERRDSSNREGGVRRGSTGGSVSGKRYDTDKRWVDIIEGVLTSGCGL